MIKQAIIAIAAMSASVSVLAATQCNVYPESEVIPQDKFQQQLKEQGYEIKKFKVSKGNCYEIYGRNKDGKKVEIYFDRKTGEVVKSEIED